MRALFQKDSENTEDSQFLIMPLILSVMASLALVLVLVWMNIERTQLRYTIRDSLAKQLDLAEDRNAKLSVEREVLLSPQWLKQKAGEMELVAAKPGQVRRMGAVEQLEQDKNKAGASNSFPRTE